MKSVLFKLILLFATCVLTLGARPIQPHEIIVVDITSKDIGLKIESVEEYDENRSHRDAFRSAMAEFLNVAKDKAAFILIDMWFPDVHGMPGEERLMSALQGASKVAIAYGGPHNQQYEQTHPRFASRVAEMGHILFNAEDPKDLIFYPTLCSEGADWPSMKHPCPKDLQQRHIALIAAEKYLGVELRFQEGAHFVIPRNRFRPFRRISFSTFKKDPNIIQDKIVILINRPLPHLDMFKLSGRQNISGSEILAMLIVLYSEYFPVK